MMSEELIRQIGAPYFYVTAQTSQVLDTWMLGQILHQPTYAVRHIRGTKSTRDHAFFDEISAVLQFPYYFGENWNAVNDCLQDLQWLPVAGYLLVITDAHLLFSEEADVDGGWRILIRQLADAGEYWCQPGYATEPGTLPRPFHVVLQSSTEADSQAVISRLIQLEYPFAMLL